jgi:hypothetical protein
VWVFEGKFRELLETICVKVDLMAAVLLTFRILLFHLHLLPRGCSKQGLLSTLQLNYILSVLGCRIMSYNIVSVDAFTARLVANWIVCPLVKFAT